MKLRNFSRAVSGALLCLPLVLTAALYSAESDVGALRTKAESGNAIAQYNLGMAYLDGQQVPKDVVEAYVWLTLAAENGATGKALKALTPTMSADQVAAAQTRLTERRGLISNNLLAQSAIGTSGSSPTPRAVRTVDAPPPTIAVPVAAPAPAPAPAAAAPAAGDRVAALTKELAALRADNTKLSADLLAAWKELDAAKVAQTDIGRKAELADAAAQKAAVDTRTIAAERDQLRQQLASALAAARPAAPAPDTAAQTKALAAAEEARTKAAADLETLRRQLAGIQKTNTDLSTQVERLTGEGTALKAQVAAGRETGRKLEEAQAALTRLQAENAELKARPAPAPATQTKALAAAEEARTRAAADLETLRRQLAAIQKTNTDLSAQAERLTGEGTALKAQVAAGRETGRKLEEAQAALTRLQAENAELKARPAAPPPAAEVSADELARLKQELARAKETIEMTVRSYKLTRDENEQLKARLNQILQAAGGAPDAAPKPAR